MARAAAALTAERPGARGASPCDRLTELRAEVDRLVPALADAGSWSEGERRTALRAVDRLVAAASAVRAHLLLAERDAGGWRASGAASFAQWRGAPPGAGGARVGAAGTGAGAAAREERQAEALVGLPAVADAVRAGELGLAHASVIGAVAADPSERVRAAAVSPSGQAELVALAQGQGVPSFARAVQRWAATHDEDALENAHQAQRRARFLHLGTSDQGTRISGRLDAVAGHRLRLALEAVTPRPAADDDRTSEQRAADALVTLAEGALTEPGTAPGAAVRPHVSVLVREETWRRHRRHRAEGGTPRDGGATPGGATGATPVPGPAGPATWEDGTPLPRSEVDRVLCDCDLTRVVLDAADAPLNLGRTQRTYTGVQRRAVIARDRSCRWPGCVAQARWCEIHHIRWWGRDGGETSVGNGVLLCSFHHHEVHRRDLALSRVGAPVRETLARDRGDRRGRARTRAGSALAETDARDPGGGARYRFVSGDGRVVAGPSWTPPPETAGGRPSAGSAPGTTGSAPGADGAAGPASAPASATATASVRTGTTAARVDRTWHTGAGRPSSRHHQDAFDGIPP